MSDLLRETIESLKMLRATKPGVLMNEDGAIDIYGVTPWQLDLLLALGDLAVEAQPFMEVLRVDSDTGSEEREAFEAWLSRLAALEEEQGR